MATQIEPQQQHQHPSAYVEQAARRCFSAGWMSRIKWAREVCSEGGRYFHLDVPSETRDGVVYRVVYDADLRTWRCSCPAGHFEHACKHCTLCATWLGLRDIR